MTTGARVAVVTAAQAADIDRIAIASGIPSRALMQRAGSAAAAEIARRWPRALRRGIAIFAGPGNNGGDGWVVAAAMAASGIRVRVREIGEPRTDDGRAERGTAFPLIERGAPHGGEEIVVDALLGTGASGAPRGAIADAIAEIADRRSHGARVVALDVPSGLDATTGSADGSVVADMTLTFGTMKRGLLVSRARCGRIVVLDIGLGAHAREASGDPDGKRTADPGVRLPRLIDAAWARRHVVPIRADAHKGARRRLAIVGGGAGMAGASILAARAAMASGIGIVRLFVDPGSVAAAQTAAYEALAARWPEDDEEATTGISDWAHAVLVGPGLGASGRTRAVAERILTIWNGPAVVDADALNVFEGEPRALRDLLAGRPAVITPHVTEFARLAGCTPDDVLADRFEIGATLARDLDCVVLLKGVPTVISAPDGRVIVSAAGTPALAAGGSGDLLAGTAATLLAQGRDPFIAAASAAAVHGRAAELAHRRRTVRGVLLDDVLGALTRVWSESDRAHGPPVLAELPVVGDPG